MITPHFIKKTGYFSVLFISVFTVLFINGCDESNEEMLARIDALETQMDHVEEQLQTMTERLKNLTALLKENTTTIQSTELAAIKTDLTEAATQRDTVIAEAKELRTEIQQLYTQLEQQVKSTEMLQMRIAALHEPTLPPEEELENTEQAQSQKPVVGFPEGPEPEEDQEVIVIRGRTQN